MIEKSAYPSFHTISVLKSVICCINRINHYIFVLKKLAQTYGLYEQNNIIFNYNYIDFSKKHNRTYYVFLYAFTIFRKSKYQKESYNKYNKPYK